MKIQPATTWVTATTFAQANASGTNQLNMTVGVSEDIINAQTNIAGYAAAGTIYTAIGLDVTNAASADCIFSYASQITPSNPTVLTSSYSGYVGIGLHALTFLTGTNGTAATFDGTNSNTKSGITGTMFC